MTNQMNYQMNSVEFSTLFKHMVEEKGNPEARRGAYAVKTNTEEGCRLITYEECVCIQANVSTTFAEDVSAQEVIISWIIDNTPQKSVHIGPQVIQTIDMLTLTLLCKVIRHIEQVCVGQSIEDCWNGKHYNGHSSRKIRDHIADKGWLDITEFCDTAKQRRTGAEDIIGLVWCSISAVLAEICDKLELDISRQRNPVINKKRRLSAGVRLSGNDLLEDLIETFVNLNDANGAFPELTEGENELTPLQEKFFEVIAGVFSQQIKRNGIHGFSPVSNKIWTCAYFPNSHRFEPTTRSAEEPFRVSYQISDVENPKDWATRAYPSYKEICRLANILNDRHFKKERDAILKAEEETRVKALADLDSWIDAPEMKTQLERVEPRPPKLIKNSKGLPKDNGAECKRWDALYAKTHEQNGKPKKSKK